jgi:SAM-dependent methyltransferase
MTFKQSRRDALLKLAHLSEQTEAVGETMRHEAERFANLRTSEPARVVSSFNLFQTPEPIADQLAAMIGDVDGKRILEPSAGLGRLYHAVNRIGTPGEWVLVDDSPACCAELYRLNEKLIQSDFLACDAERLGGLFDLIAMNPPFKMGRDIKHIKHAYNLLNPGGLLVSLCFDGVKQNENLRPLVDSWEVLPPGSFKAEGTKASVALLTWTK